MTIQVESQSLTAAGSRRRWRAIGWVQLSMGGPFPFKARKIPIPMRFNEWGDASGGPYKAGYPRYRCRVKG